MLWPFPVSGKVIRTAFASWRTENWLLSVDDDDSEGSKVHSMVSSPATLWPSRVVAAKDKDRERRRGMRNVLVQPAPRMRRSSSFILGY